MKNNAFSFIADRDFWKFYGIYQLFLVLIAFTSFGWMQADEHSRVIEPVTKLIYGHGSVPWELEPSPLYPPHVPLVSWLLAVLHAPVLWILKFFNWSGLTEAAWLRVWTSLFSATKIIAFKSVLDWLDLKKERKYIYLLLLCFLFYNPFLMVRTSQENWGGTALVWALYFVLKNKNFPHVKNVLWGGVFLALAVSFRLQLGFSAACLGLFFVAQRFQNAGWLAAGLIVGLIPVACVDFYFTGMPFFPAFNYLKYAVFEYNTPDLWGTQDWTYYLIGFAGHWYAPLSPLLFVLILVGCWKEKRLAAVFVPFTIVNFILSHKEIRYFSPMVPFMQLTCFLGWEALEKKYSLKTWMKKSCYFIVWAYCLLGVIWAIALPPNSAPLLYEELRKEHEKYPNEKLTYVGNTRVNVSILYYKHYQSLPDRISEDNFVQMLHEAPHLIAKGKYALYRMDARTLKEVEKKCKLVYLANPQWYRTLIELIDFFPKRKRLDAIVECGK